MLSELEFAELAKLLKRREVWIFALAAARDESYGVGPEIREKIVGQIFQVKHDLRAWLEKHLGEKAE